MNEIKKVLLCPWDNRTQFDFMDQGDLKKKKKTRKIEKAQPRAFVHTLSLYLCGFINVKFHSAYKSGPGQINVCCYLLAITRDICPAFWGLGPLSLVFIVSMLPHDAY